MVVDIERPANTSEVAKWVAAHRKPKLRPCAKCGTMFLATGRGLYCKPKCAWMVANRDRAARIKASATMAVSEAR